MRSAIMSVRTWCIVTATLLVVVFVRCPVFAEESPEAHVAALIANGSALPRNKQAEDALVALGDAAIPALTSALRVGVRGEDARVHRDAGASRRPAVVRVLARIPGERVTSILVAALADPPDTEGMRRALLAAVEARALAREQLATLLGSNQPDPVLIALRKLGPVPKGHKLRLLVEGIFDAVKAKKHFRNQHGAPTASANERWAVHLASGQALGVDMIPEMRMRAVLLFSDLHTTAKRMTSDVPEFNASRNEWDALRSIRALRSLGSPIQDMGKNTPEDASLAEAALWDIARVALGDSERIPRVLALLAESPDGSLRYCAASILAESKDPRVIPALWDALGDPLRRELHGCLPGTNDHYFPVRHVAVRALIALGEDPKAVRAKAAQGK